MQMCGFVGIISRDNDVVYDLYFALHTLQHRGQDGAGILTFNGSSFHLKKDVGLVSEVFDFEALGQLKGKIGIGHVRYPTMGSNSHTYVQPFLVHEPFDMALCHNGNLVNYDEIRKDLETAHNCKLTSNSDGEAILALFAAELKGICGNDCNEADIFSALANVEKKLNGGYSCVSVIGDKGLFAYRDPYAIRPLIFGEKVVDGKVIAYGFASESVALDVLGFRIIKDLEPGEAVVVDKNMRYHSKIVAKGSRRHCMFEWVYFARPDSVIENKGVYEVRLNLGEELAAIWRKKGIKADVVIPAPDTSKTAALSFAEAIGVPYREGLIKNRYVGRTFIMPNQKRREFGVKIKLNPVIREIKDKRVILVDDSIVRGTTSRKIVDMVRAAGAKEVHFVVTCPPIKYPCFYAIDFASKRELIAAEKDVDAIRKELGADSLTYQEIGSLKQAIGLGGNLCMACLNGEYVTPVSEEQKKTLGETRDRERSVKEPVFANIGV